MLALMALFFARDRPAPASQNPPLDIRDSFNAKQEQKVGDIRTGDVNISFGTAAPPSAPLSKTTSADVDEVLPQVRFLSASVVPVSHNVYSSPFVFHKSTEAAHPKALIACFRNSAEYEEQINTAYNVKAYFRFFDLTGAEIETGFAGAPWLGHPCEVINIPRDESRWVIVLLQGDNKKLFTLWKDRVRVGAGRRATGITEDNDFSFQETPHSVEIRLRDKMGDGDLLLPPLVLEILSDNKLVTGAVKRLEQP